MRLETNVPVDGTQQTRDVAIEEVAPKKKQDEKPPAVDVDSGQTQVPLPPDANVRSPEKPNVRRTLRLRATTTNEKSAERDALLDPRRYKDNAKEIEASLAFAKLELKRDPHFARKLAYELAIIARSCGAFPVDADRAAFIQRAEVINQTAEGETLRGELKYLRKLIDDKLVSKHDGKQTQLAVNDIRHDVEMALIPLGRNDHIPADVKKGLQKVAVEVRTLDIQSAIERGKELLANAPNLDEQGRDQLYRLGQWLGELSSNAHRTEGEAIREGRVVHKKAGAALDAAEARAKELAPLFMEGARKVKGDLTIEQRTALLKLDHENATLAELEERMQIAERYAKGGDLGFAKALGDVVHLALLRYELGQKFRSMSAKEGFDPAQELPAGVSAEQADALLARYEAIDSAVDRASVISGLDRLRRDEADGRWPRTTAESAQSFLSQATSYLNPTDAEKKEIGEIRDRSYVQAWTGMIAEAEKDRDAGFAHLLTDDRRFFALQEELGKRYDFEPLPEFAQQMTKLRESAVKVIKELRDLVTAELDRKLPDFETQIAKLEKPDNPDPIARLEAAGAIETSLRELYAINGLLDRPRTEKLDALRCKVEVAGMLAAKEAYEGALASGDRDRMKHVSQNVHKRGPGHYHPGAAAAGISSKTLEELTNTLWRLQNALNTELKFGA